MFDYHQDLEPKNRNIRKYIIWLSDGRAENPKQVYQLLKKLAINGVHTEAIIFGRGDTSLAKLTGTPFIRSKSPIDLMAAFADSFRRIVSAPYKINAKVSESPSFERISDISEAWVVVYGNDALSKVNLTNPAGKIMLATYAQDRWPGAGAYKVAYLPNPEPGKWKINVQNRAADTAYAVIQNSSLYPFLESPAEAYLNTEIGLIASIKSNISKTKVTSPVF